MRSSFKDAGPPWARRAVWLTALALGLAACGERPAGDADAPVRGPAALDPATWPEDPDPVHLPERARYALDRLLRGPRPMGDLRVRDSHSVNLDLAAADLVALERETLLLLADDELREQVLGGGARMSGPWHGVLRVLGAIRGEDAKVALAWTKPILTSPEALGDSTLVFEAVGVLATVDDARVGATLLALFRDGAAEGATGIAALKGLLALGSPWKERALRVALERGTRRLWDDLAHVVGALVPPQEVDPDLVDALAWWAVLAQGSGPRTDVELPHLKAHRWTSARLAIDASVPGVGTVRGAGPVYGPLSSTVAYGSGWFTSGLVDQPVLPLWAFVDAGHLSAARARCLLATWDQAAARLRVEADRRGEEDPELQAVAEHCLMVPQGGTGAARAAVEAALVRVAPWQREDMPPLQKQVAALDPADPEDWRLLERVLREVRPLEIAGPVLERTYATMHGRLPDLVGVLRDLLGSDDASDRGVALSLMQRFRDAAHVPLLEAALERAQTRQEVGALRRTLTFIYGQAPGIPPERRLAFVAQYVSWMEEGGPRDIATMATGLLDHDDAGAEAFARGLLGEHRAAYLEAWPRHAMIVPRVMAEAAMAGVDESTSSEEVRAVLEAAYTTFPATAAPSLAALGERLRPEQRPLVEPALDRVRHRAPRHREVK